MFAKPRTKYVVPAPRKKRKIASTIDEIAFDTSAREDYLTGFHKRKLQRIKRSKEEAAKKEREEKLVARKILRDGRKADLEKHVEAVNSMLREQGGVVSDSSDSEIAVQGEQWDGITEDPTVDHEDEYIDDDRFTTVTVEAVDVSKDGMHKIKQDDGDRSEGSGTEKPSVEASGGLTGRGRPPSQKAKRIWTKEAPSGVKKKKQKFRYESKAERKVTRYKERSGNKAKAKARKE